MGTQVIIPLPEGDLSGWVSGTGPTGILLAHGAGTNQDHPLIVGLREALAEVGHTVMTFNYPYSERGSRRPDRTERLLTAHRAAADRLRPQVDRLFLAGRSMGGRMGTYLVADGYPADGLILYAYPLHPAGKETELRVDHLSDVGRPMLFLVGTRDALSRMEPFERHVRPLPGVTVEVLEGADHSFRGGGWTPETVLARLVTATTVWIAALPSGRSGDARP
jgi:predicted alpha/beta-hydrolase family hydrolase